MKKFTPFDKFEQTCGPNGKPLAESMQSNCNDRLAPDTPQPCSAKPCPPYWQLTGESRCLPSGLVDVQEADGCGNLRWVRSTELVVWTDTGETECDEPSNRIQKQQVNQCGEFRLLSTPTLCCIPEWVSAVPDPIYNCDQSMLRVQQEDGCGNERLHPTGYPVSWVDSMERRCLEELYQREETNQCGTDRWVTISPYIWTDTGDTQCIGALIQKEQANQCGDLRWVNTDASIAWVDTVNKDCTDGYEVQQVNQCNETRWDPRGAVIWTNTGQTRCITDDLIEVEQVNQCGELRWVFTGVSCVVVLPSLPTSIGPGCIIDDTNGFIQYSLSFGSSGAASETINPGGGSPHIFTWAPGTVDGSNYEIKVTHTFVIGPNRTYTGPAVDVWTSLASTVGMLWQMNPAGVPSSSVWGGTIQIRENGDDLTITEMTIDEIFMGLGVECP